MPSYPNSVISFATVNPGDVIASAVTNSQNAEITAIESGITQGTAHLKTSNSTVINLSVTGNSTFAGNQTVSGNSSVVGTLGVTGSVTFSSIVTATAQPRCHVYNTAAQSVNDSAETALTFNAQDFSVGSMHSTGTNPTRITFKETGLFLIGAKVVFAAGIVGNRYLRFEKTSGASTSNVGSRVSAPPDGSNFGSADPIAISNVVPIAIASTGDYVQVIAFHSQGGALNTGSATRSLANECWAVKVW